MELEKQFRGKCYDGRKPTDPDRDKRILKPGMTVLFRDKLSGRLTTSDIVEISDQYQLKFNSIAIRLQGFSALYLEDCLQIIKPYEYPIIGLMKISECLLKPGRINDKITQQV